MTPLQRCLAAGCCPLGLALRAKNAWTECTWARRPRAWKAADALMEAGCDVSESQCYLIAGYWDQGQRAKAANMAAELELI